MSRKLARGKKKKKKNFNGEPGLGHIDHMII